MSRDFVIDFVKVSLVQVGAIALTMQDTTDFLKLLSVGIALGYTAWKWITDVREYRRKNNIK